MCAAHRPSDSRSPGRAASGADGSGSAASGRPGRRALRRFLRGPAPGGPPTQARCSVTRSGGCRTAPCSSCGRSPRRRVPPRPSSGWPWRPGSPPDWPERRRRHDAAPPRDASRRPLAVPHADPWSTSWCSRRGPAPRAASCRPARRMRTKRSTGTAWSAGPTSRSADCCAATRGTPGDSTPCPPPPRSLSRAASLQSALRRGLVGAAAVPRLLEPVLRSGQRRGLGSVDRRPGRPHPHPADPAVRQADQGPARHAGAAAADGRAQEAVRQRPAEALRRDDEALSGDGHQPAVLLPADHRAGAVLLRPVPRAVLRLEQQAGRGAHQGRGGSRSTAPRSSAPRSTRRSPRPTRCT